MRLGVDANIILNEHLDVAKLTKNSVLFPLHSSSNLIFHNLD